MTIGYIVDTNIPKREVQIEPITGGSHADLTIKPVFADFVVQIPPLNSERPALTLANLAELLPRRMSSTHIEQIRTNFPQPPATDDPATYEFESQQD